MAKDYYDHYCQPCRRLMRLEREANAAERDDRWRGNLLKDLLATYGG